MLSEGRWLSEHHPIPLFILNQHYSHRFAYLATARSVALWVFNCDARTYKSPGTLEHSPVQFCHPAPVTQWPW